MNERQLHFRVGLLVITAGIVAAGLVFRFGEMRVKHDVRASGRRPSNRLGIAEPLVADRYPEFQWAHLEKTPVRARPIEPFLRWVELRDLTAASAEEHIDIMGRGTDDAAR